MKRIEKFLKEKEINNNLIKTCKNEENAIEIIFGYFTWRVRQKNDDKKKNGNISENKEKEADSEKDNIDEPEVFDEYGNYIIIQNSDNNLNLNINENHKENHNNNSINNNVIINTNINNNIINDCHNTIENKKMN